MLILLIIVLLGLLSFAISGPLGAPWVPTFKTDVKQVLDDAGVKKGTRYVELGCGDGRLVAAAAARGAHAVGYEINPVLWLYATIRNLRYKNAHISFGNFWRHDLKNADAVVAFLMPKFMLRLESKASAELSPGSCLVSYVFALPSTKPLKKGDHWFVYKY
jgi:SAM-dependent methyltransferase